MSLGCLSRTSLPSPAFLSTSPSSTRGFLSFHLAPTAFELPEAYHCPRPSPDHSSPRPALCPLHNSAVFPTPTPTTPAFVSPAGLFTAHQPLLLASCHMCSGHPLFMRFFLPGRHPPTQLCLYCLNPYIHTLSHPLPPHEAFPDLLRAPQYFPQSSPCV